MTPYGRDDAPRPFTPAELDGVDAALPDEVLALGRVARELEAAADRGSVRASADFSDRVMRSIAAEPSPAPVRAAGAAVRRRSLAAMLMAFRDALRVSFGAGFPVAVRAQALALVLVVTAVFATGSGMATVGAVRLISGNPLTGVPGETSPAATPAPTETPQGRLDPAAADGSPEPSEPAEPSASDHPEASGSEEPGETPEATDNHSGGSPGHGGASGSPAPTSTPHPTESDGHDGNGHDGGPNPSDTPRPTDGTQPEPSSMPDGSPTPSPAS